MDSGMAEDTPALGLAQVSEWKGHTEPSSACKWCATKGTQVVPRRCRTALSRRASTALGWYRFQPSRLLALPDAVGLGQFMKHNLLGPLDMVRESSHLRREVITRVKRSEGGAGNVSCRSPW